MKKPDEVDILAARKLQLSGGIDAALWRTYAEGSQKAYRQFAELDTGGKPVTHMENTSIARYVWLPIKWQGDKPTIRWQEEWKI